VGWVLTHYSYYATRLEGVVRDIVFFRGSVVTFGFFYANIAHRRP
jgi:hypothetical protein